MTCALQTLSSSLGLVFSSLPRGFFGANDGNPDEVLATDFLKIAWSTFFMLCVSHPEGFVLCFLLKVLYFMFKSMFQFEFIFYKVV